MEHVSSSMDFPAPGVFMPMVPNMPNYHELQHFSVSMDPISFVEPMPYGSEFNNVLMANKNASHMNPSDGSVGSSSILVSTQPGLVDAPIADVISGRDKLLPLERNSETGHVWKSSVSQQEQLLSSKRTVLRADDRPLVSVQSPESQRKTGPVQQHNLGSPASQAHSALSKRKAPTESSGKSGAQRGRPAKKQTAKIDSATKPHPESSDAVRSKMRESLASALALASQKPGNISTAKKDKGENTITHQIPVGSQGAESNSMVGGNVPHSVIKEMVPSEGSTLGSTASDSREFTCEFSPKRSNFNGGESFQEVQFNSILSDGDVQFSDNVFVKDDLLQGNGLSWAVQVDAQMEEGGEAQNGDKPPSAADFHDHVDKVPFLIPENLAFKIEAELFKLYGGLNKKYREKGRSLLFNLKDHKNPELRERVMSGKISPERLCSMSAEELASKELSEWRIAKAEEMAQMVVLPDTEVDMRRLVKKTHKGEYQVEFDHDDGIADEVSSGSSLHAQRLPKKEIENHSSSPNLKDKENVAGQEKTSENQEFSGSLIIPTDESDLMQGMMVDELKDASSLPPIVSLDEFMESLNSEPPFENISEDAARKIPLAHNVSPKATQASRRAPVSPRDAPSRRPDVGKKYRPDMTVKSSGLEKKNLPSTALNVKSVWEGVLQLNISSFVAVRGLFQSGEKTSTKDWSTSVEIKGRVRLDAFEKFLQELPKSRTRALMILQFVLKDKSSETQLAAISEAVDSYTSDERLGFAEPAAGVELYICPPTPRIAELLNKHLPKESRQADNNNSMETGLIGVVVWRRAHVSPISSSHHKHSSKKQPFSSSNRLQDSSNANGNVVSPATRASAPLFNNMSHPKPEPEVDDDDIPPGFGPAAAKDEDDLPEFNFSGGFNSFTTSLSSQEVHRDVKTTPTPTPIDHVRELIKKYGQSDTVTMSEVKRKGLRVEVWDDDDDDIPEWQPEAATGPPENLVARGGNSLLVNRQPVPGGQWRPPHRHMHGARWKQ